MGRIEATIQGSGSLARFAADLRELRRAAGNPSYRELAKAAHFSPATLSQAASGKAWPTLPVTLAYVRACGGDETVWRDRWERDQCLGERGVCPYRGLEAFTAEHAGWFHGRTAAAEQVLAALTGPRRAVLLLGASGAGKSSLVQAGVLPALGAGALPGSDQWIPLLARPGQDLRTELGRAGLPSAGELPLATAVERLLAGQPAGARLLLVVDQFEELLIAPAAGAQYEVLDQLTAAIGSTTPLTVVLVMRDDFYPQLAARAPELLRALTPGLVNVPATLSTAELRDIITKPAHDVGIRCQDGLTERIITDVLAADPGAAAARRAPVTMLPLLELTLQQLWQRRQDGCLSHEAYQRIGGVTGSLVTWCDTAINQLPAAQLPAARTILTALVRPADDTRHIPAVRQPRPIALLRELAETRDPTSGGRPTQQSADQVLTVLTGNRIVTTRTVHAVDHPDETPGVPVAELVHDMLIHDWSTLRDWVSQDHHFHDWLRRADEQRSRWAHQRAAGDLLHGTDLAEGLHWARQRRLPEDVAEFLAASHGRQQAQTRRAWRLNAILAVLLVAALAAAGLALWQRHTAVAAQREALSRQLAAQSANLLGTDPDLASLLAVEGYRASPTVEATTSVYAAAALPARRRLTAHTEGVHSVAFSPDGRTLATGSFDGTARLWEVATGKPRATLTGHSTGVNAVAFSADGRTLATGSADGTARLWDATTGHAGAALTGHPGGVYAVAFSPDGRTLATGGGDGILRLWDPTSGKVRLTLTGDTEGVGSVAFSADGHTLLTVGSVDGTARLWDATSGQTRTALTDRTATVGTLSPDGRTLATGGNADGTARLWDVTTGKAQAVLTGHSQTVASVAFSPDGRTLATGSADGTARLWDVPAAQVHILGGATGPVYTVAFSPDGRTLATGGRDGTARLWDVASGQTLAALTGHTAPVNDLAFSPDGRTLATSGADGTARLWDVATGQRRATLTVHNESFKNVAFSPDGHTLATGSFNGTIRLWDAATGRARTTLTNPTGPTYGMAFSPDWRTLAAGGDDGTAVLWDLATGQTRTLSGASGTVFTVALSPDWRTLATGSADGTVRLWDLATGHIRTTLTGHTKPVYKIAFSPDGRTLATSSRDGTIRLWDVATARIRTTLSGHTAPVTSVAFSPDGRTLAIGDDNSPTLWDVALPDPAAAINKICQAVNRTLTPQEQATYLPQNQPVACRP